MHTYQALSHSYLSFLHWLLLSSLIAFTGYVLWDSQHLPTMLDSDFTRISLVILLVFILSCLHGGYRSWFISHESKQLAKQLLLFSQSGNTAAKVTDTPPLLYFYTSPVTEYLHYAKQYSHAKPEPTQEATLAAEVLAERCRGQHQVGWFIVGALIKLGLLGTVIGFVLMLNSIGDISHIDIQKMQSLVETMTQGMRIALATTIIALVCSLLLGIQYLLLDRHADQLIANTLSVAERLKVQPKTQADTDGDI